MRLPTEEEKKLAEKLNKAKSIEEKAKIYNDYFQKKKEKKENNHG